MAEYISYQIRLVTAAIFLFSGVLHAEISDHRVIDNASGMMDDFDDFDDEFEESDQVSTFDPARGYNRFMVQVNDKLYYWILKPVAKGYGKVVPKSGRRAIRRFFRNSVFPVRVVNNVLQLKFKSAGNECLRFGINSTLGILGFGDPATSKFHVKEYKEDFGQTLGHYGIGPGFHLVLPILGPSNLRDTVGLIPDSFLTWYNYLNSDTAQIAVTAFRHINRTSFHIGEYESLKKDAVDFYILMRDSYEQNRKMKISE